MTDISKLIKQIEDHEKRISVLEKNFKSKKIPVKKNDEPKSITDYLVILKEEGFFNEPKSRKEIVKELAKRGQHYEPKSIDSPLQKAFKTKKIGRLKKNGIFHYVKR